MYLVKLFSQLKLHLTSNILLFIHHEFIMNFHNINFFSKNKVNDTLVTKINSFRQQIGWRKK